MKHDTTFKERFAKGWWLPVGVAIGIVGGFFNDWPFRAAPPPANPIEWPLDNPKKGNT